MTSQTHRARITAPLPYLGSGGRPARVPLGPCRVERLDGNLAEITWGAGRQHSLVLPMPVLAAAAYRGHLVLLD